MRPTIYFGVFVLVFLLPLPPAFAESPARLDPLQKLNLAFREEYGKNRAELQASLPLVIVVRQREIAWMRYGKAGKVAVPLTRYTEAKSLVHAMLAVFGIGSRLVRDGATEQEWKDAAALRRRLREASRLIGKAAIPEMDRTRIRAIVGRLDGALADWIQRRALTEPELFRVLKAVRPEMLLLVKDVGREHFADTRRALEQIRAQVPSQDWKRAIVVVAGGPAARRDNLETAAVISLFGRRALGERILYAENIFASEAAFAYSAGLQADRALSTAVFGNPYRMWRDLFGDVSRGAIGGGFNPDLRN